jgi:hypothetical protein
MLSIFVVTITFMRTRPHPQLTSRLPTVGYVNGFPIALVKTNIQVVGGVGQV